MNFFLIAIEELTPDEVREIEAELDLEEYDDDTLYF